MEILKNDYFTLISEDDKLFITVSRPGYDIKDFNNLLLDMPTLQLNDFSALRNALKDAKGQRALIGSLRPRVEVLISGDEMEARLKLNITAKEFVENKIGISSEIIETLNSKDITEGLDNLFQKPITVQREILVAKGIPPEEGEDAKLTYYKISDKKPVVMENGSVNHYELNLIDNVHKGDWLGEKVLPTEGKPGKTVTGKIIPGKRGKDTKLIYDRKTVELREEDGKEVLRALSDGAVRIEGGKIRIDNHLVIAGDVGYETGNIHFDGFVTINGTVKDGFSITAKDDISILGVMGIGAVGKIVSTEGSIYIKGGAYGKNTAKIEAKKNVFVKYCNECFIQAGEDINVGFYALDSHLVAKKIILDPLHGRVIGGNLVAEVQIIAGIIGNKSEKKTTISVQGFDRLAVKAEFEGLLRKYKDLLQEANRLKRNIEIFECNISGAEYANMEEYRRYVDQHESILREIHILDEYRLRLQQILETKGEGEIGVFKAAYPETYLEIKNMHKKINTVVSGTFYAMDRELHHN